MVLKGHMGKKELFQVDEFQTLWKTVQLYVEKNIKQLATIGIIICFIVAGFGFWIAKQKANEKKAVALLYSALSVMAKNSENAVEREINFNQAIDGFEKIANKYSSTNAAGAAFFYSGVCSYKLNKFDEAISYYNKFLKNSKNTFDHLVPVAYEGIGYSYEAKGEYNKALEYFQEQNSREVADENSMALLNIARCYEDAGDDKNACRFYKSFVEKNPPSTFSEIAQVKIAVLCSDEQN